jgi:hypothetical protein
MTDERHRPRDPLALRSALLDLAIAQIDAVLCSECRHLLRGVLLGDIVSSRDTLALAVLSCQRGLHVCEHG